MKKQIASGAEATIYLEKGTVTKHRVSKSYRHPELDKQIIKRRITPRKSIECVG